MMGERTKQDTGQGSSAPILTMGEKHKDPKARLAYDLKSQTVKFKVESPKAFSEAQKELVRAREYFGKVTGLDLPTPEIYINDMILEENRCAAAYDVGLNAICISPEYLLGASHLKRLPELISHEYTHFLRYNLGLEKLSEYGEDVYVQVMEETFAIFSAMAFETRETADPQARASVLAGKKSPFSDKKTILETAKTIADNFPTASAIEKAVAQIMQKNKQLALRKIEDELWQNGELPGSEAAAQKKAESIYVQRAGNPAEDKNLAYLQYLNSKAAMRAMLSEAVHILSKSPRATPIRYLLGEALSAILAASGDPDKTVRLILTQPRDSLSVHIFQTLEENKEGISGFMHKALDSLGQKNQR